MSFWKIAAGAALGVGAIAAAPFTGGGSLLGAATLASSLAGVGTIAAATAAGAAGAAAGYAIAESDEERADQYRNEGRQEAQEDINKLAQALEEYEQKISDQKQYFDLLISLVAVGFATANCDGEICEQERADINEFISGLAASGLPEDVKSTIFALGDNPPSIAQAYSLASNLPDYPKDLFNEVIDVVMHADGVVHASEEQFKQKWQILNAA